jgi:hypothetical protein
VRLPLSILKEKYLARAESCSDGTNHCSEAIADCATQISIVHPVSGTVVILMGVLGYSVHLALGLLRLDLFQLTLRLLDTAIAAMLFRPAPGDTLNVFSDGVVDAQSPTGELLDFIVLTLQFAPALTLK